MLHTKIFKKYSEQLKSNCRILNVTFWILTNSCERGEKDMGWTINNVILYCVIIFSYL
jgi:hypothetical protein